MGQRPFWRYKDDDKTLDINAWLLGLLPSGLYRGFDHVPTVTWMFTLNHATTGYRFYDINQVAGAKYGITISPQGTLVQEDSVIEVPIGLADPTLPRIDLIVAQHSYVAVTGGQPQVYKVIPGTASASPTGNYGALNAATDVVLGELLIPANASNLSEATYTKKYTPYLADDALGHLLKPNRFTKIQHQDQGSLLTVSSDNKIILNDEGNIFFVRNTENTNLKYISETEIGTEITLIFLDPSGVDNWGTDKDGTSLRIEDLTEAAVPSTGFRRVILGTERLSNEYIKDGMVVSLRFVDVDGIPAWKVVNIHRGNNNDAVRTIKSAEQRVFNEPSLVAFSGCRLKQVNYTVGITNYTAWIFELDSRNENYILDLDNSAQLNGFNIATDKVELRFCDLHSTEFDSSYSKGNGWCPTIILRKNSGSVTFYGTITGNPVPSSGYALLANTSNLLNLNTNNVGAAIIPLGIFGTSKVSLLALKFFTGEYYTLLPESAYTEQAGGTNYASPFLTDGTSYKNAIAALGNTLNALTQGTNSLSGVTLVTSNVAITFFNRRYNKVGNLITFSLRGAVSINIGSVASVVIKFSVPWEIVGTTTIELGGGAVTNEGSDTYIATLERSGSFEVTLRIDGQSNITGASPFPVDFVATGSYTTVN